jgi:dihydrolipoamide dehydrogenase
MTDAYDVAILGGGPGGYATALRAATHGLRAVIIEGGDIGGTCLHRGCVPSKALLHVAHLADQVPRLRTFGLAEFGGGLDASAVGDFRDRIVDQLARGLGALLDSREVHIVRGRGRVIDAGAVAVDDGSVVRAKNVVIATGSVPADLPTIKRDGRAVLSSDDVLRLDHVPQSALVVGGGAVGVEMASMWRSFGTEVTLIEAAERLLPLEDPDSSSALAKAFERRGISVRTRTVLSEVTVDERVRARFDDGSATSVDQMLLAVGRTPATEDCGLEGFGVLDDSGYVVVDVVGRTAIEGVWAVGDVVRTLALAHAAFAEGFTVADGIAGKNPFPVDPCLVPRVTYCWPEVASVGLTEPEAREQYGDVRVTTTPLAGNARALIDGVGGHVKLIADTDGVLLGGHIVGPCATELIGELSLAATWQALVSELGEITHAHPTVSESLREGALAAAGMPFHSHGLS